MRTGIGDDGRYCLERVLVRDQRLDDGECLGYGGDWKLIRESAGAIGRGEGSASYDRIGPQERTWGARPCALGAPVPQAGGVVVRRAAQSHPLSRAMRAASTRLAAPSLWIASER